MTSNRLNINGYIGFTLVETLIVIAILGVLMAISIPAYHNFTIRSANTACLHEVKDYTSYVLLKFNQPNNANGRVSAPISSSCLLITDASTWSTLGMQISAIAKNPGNAIITCDLTNGGNCSY